MKKKTQLKQLDDKQLALVTGGDNTQPIPWLKGKPRITPDDNTEPLPW